MTVSLQSQRSDRAYHDFLVGAKRYWSNDVYRALRDRVCSGFTQNDGVDDIEHTLRDDPLYQSYGWFERNLQKLKYTSPHGILAIVERNRTVLTEALDKTTAEGVARGLLRFNPDFVYPDYYTKVDFHQHPGGVWRDCLAGFAYEFGRQTTVSMHIDPWAVHDLMAAATPTEDYRRILDWGCGIGTSTLPFAKLYPKAELFGIDVSEPCLRLAYLRSTEKKVDVHWSQQKMEATDFPDAHFDLVHSTFLPHELPKAALKDCVREAFRILKPGGWFVNLDFHSPPGGVWGQFCHYGHARRNNEVFMRSFCETDFVGLQEDTGFRNVEMRSFDDGTGPVLADQMPEAWRFPWQLFVAQK